jgi:hypothetical protein
VSTDNPTPNEHVVSQELDGEVVLVQLQTNRIYALNATGARFWELLHAGHPVPEIRRRLLEEYDVGEAVIDAEIASLLAMLRAERLVA